MSQAGFQVQARMLVQDWAKTRDAVEFIERMDALIESGYDIDADPKNWRTLVDPVTAWQLHQTGINAGYTDAGIEAMLFDMFGMRSTKEVTQLDECAVHLAISDARYAKKFSTDKPAHVRSWVDDISAGTRAMWSQAAYDRMVANGNFSDYRI